MAKNNSLVEDVLETFRNSKPRYATTEEAIADLSRKLEEYAASREMTVEALFDVLEHQSAVWTDEEDEFFHNYNLMHVMRAHQKSSK